MSKFLETKIDEMISRSKNTAETDEVRFSLTFSKFNNRRLEYIRRALKLSKQELLSNIILAAVSDIELKLGLTTLDDEGAASLTKDYLKALNSGKPVSSLFKDE